MYYYVYLIEHIETGEFYIGSRQCKNHPSSDPYLGSMYRWKPDRKKLKKTIIKEDFTDRNEAYIFEREEILRHIENPLNKNYHVPGIGYYMSGMVVAKDLEGNVHKVEIDDYRLKNGELFGFNKGFVTVKDSNGETKRVSKDDPEYVNGILKYIWCDFVNVVDREGRRFKISKDDPKYLNGEVSLLSNKGKKLILKKRLDENHSSKFTQVGEKNSQFGTCWIHNTEGQNKKIKKEDLDEWISNGWIKGAKFAKYIKSGKYKNKKNKNKMPF